MSWFRKKPKSKEYYKPVHPHRTSPATERILDEIKQKHKTDSTKKQDK